MHDMRQWEVPLKSGGEMTALPPYLPGVDKTSLGRISCRNKNLVKLSTGPANRLTKLPIL